MKRTLKNILMILLIVILLFLTYFTMGYLKGDYSLNNNVIMELDANVVYMNEENEVITEIVDPDGTVTTTPYEGTGEGTGEVINGEVDPDTIVTNEDDILYTTTDDGVDISATSGLAENDATEKGLTFTAEKLDGISYVYYIVFGVEGLLLSLSLAYLAYSKFNKLTFKEAFDNGKRTFGYILYTILLVLFYIITVYYFI